MSQQTQAGIQLLIDNRIADNNSKDISAGDVREVLTAMNQSFSGPVMIYHGQLKSDNGGSSYDAKIDDYYVNLAFWKQQVPGSPTSSTNLVQLNTTGVPSAPDGSPTVTLLGGLVLKLTVASNVITQLEVLKIGGGVRVGSVTAYTFHGTALTFTYNGIITPKLPNFTGTFARFILSTSTAGGDHTADNTLIQASIVDSQNYIDFMRNEMTATNELACYFKGVTGNDSKFQNLTLWRVA
tara:strand:+ start:183 stop:899 length:717 start_codon:yes stop_codon:yes gene_type:complete